jgi:hypothetical protein
MPVTRLQHSKHHVSVTAVMQAITEELWEEVFSVGSVQGLYLENRNRRRVKALYILHVGYSTMYCACKTVEIKNILKIEGI